MAVLLLTEETARAASSAAASGSSLPRPASGRIVDFKAMAADPALLPARLDAVRAERLIAGTNGRLIVLVRDAHANLSAQKNIYKAAEFWAREAGIDLILSEAAWGEAGLGDARGALPAADLKRASDRLLWENLITGHEYLTLVSELPVRIVGIEDPRLYRRNWEVFRRMASGRERVSAALGRSRAAVDGMKRRDYPKDLLDHESALERNEDWVRRYHAIRALAAGSEVRFDAQAEAALEPFRAAEAAERAIDHERLAQEQELALGEARSRCGACADELLDAFEKAGSSVAALHSAVGRLAHTSGFDTRGSAAELVRYQRYLESLEALDPAALDAALETLEENLYAGLAGSRDARVTRFVDRHTKLLASAYALRLTPEETRRLNTEVLRVRPVSWQAELNDRLIAQGRAEDVLEYGSEFAPRLTAVRNFYRLAALRDRMFVRRSDEVLTGSGKNAALLIAGGYHTDRLTELFAKRGYSVAVFTPYVTDETDQAAYERTVLTSDPGSAQPSGTRVRPDASAADRSTLLAPLVRTPAGAARLASAIPGLPADPGTLAKRLLEISGMASADLPVSSGARMSAVDPSKTASDARAFDSLNGLLEVAEGLRDRAFSVRYENGQYWLETHGPIVVDLERHDHLDFISLPAHITVPGALGMFEMAAGDAFKGYISDKTMLIVGDQLAEEAVYFIENYPLIRGVVSLDNDLGATLRQIMRYRYLSDDQKSKLEIRREDIESSGLGSRRFDMAYVSGLLGYYGDPDPAYETLTRVVKPGGWLMGLFPSFFDFIDRFGRIYDYGQLQSRESLTRRSGATLIEIDPQGFATTDQDPVRASGARLPDGTESQPAGRAVRFVLAAIAGLVVSIAAFASLDADASLIAVDVRDPLAYGLMSATAFISWGSAAWLHEIGHAAAGLMFGAEVRLRRYGNFMITARLTKYDTRQRIAFLAGGPAANLIAAAVIWTVLFLRPDAIPTTQHLLLYATGVLNGAFGLGALVPVRPNAGGGLMWRLMRQGARMAAAREVWWTGDREDYRWILGADRIVLDPGIYPRTSSDAAREENVAQSIESVLTAMYAAEKEGVFVRRSGRMADRVADGSSVKIREIGAGSGIGTLAWLTRAETYGLKVLIDADDLGVRAIRNLKANLKIWSEQGPATRRIVSEQRDRFVFANGSAVRFRISTLSDDAFRSEDGTYRIVVFNSPVVIKPEYLSAMEGDESLEIIPADLVRVVRSMIRAVSPDGLVLLENSDDTFDDGRFSELQRSEWDPENRIDLTGITVGTGLDAVRKLFVLKRRKDGASAARMSVPVVSEREIAAFIEDTVRAVRDEYASADHPGAVERYRGFVERYAAEAVVPIEVQRRRLEFGEYLQETISDIRASARSLIAGDRIGTSALNLFGNLIFLISQTYPPFASYRLDPAGRLRLIYQPDRVHAYPTGFLWTLLALIGPHWGIMGFVMALTMQVYARTRTIGSNGHELTHLFQMAVAERFRQSFYPGIDPKRFMDLIPVTAFQDPVHRTETTVLGPDGKASAPIRQAPPSPERLSVIVAEIVWEAAKAGSGRTAEAEKRAAAKEFVRRHQNETLGPVRFFETPDAFYIFHGGIHAIHTPGSDHAGLVDAYAIENADDLFYQTPEWEKPADFFERDAQYQTIARVAASSDIPIYLVDEPVIERARPAGSGDTAGPRRSGRLRDRLRAVLLIGVPLLMLREDPILGLLAVIGSAHFYALRLSFSALLYHRQIGIWPLAVLGLIDGAAAGTQRSALAAHKIQTIVLPHLDRRRGGGKPLIWIDWGALHADMIPLIKYPVLRKAVLWMEKVLHPIRRQIKPDLRYADQAVWMHFEQGSSGSPALVGRVIGPDGVKSGSSASAARMAALPDEALTVDTPVRDFAEAIGLWDRGRTVRTFAEPSSGLDVYEVEADIDFDAPMPDGMGILRQLFEFKWEGLGRRKMRFYVLFDERRMPVAIYPKEGQVPESVWKKDRASYPDDHWVYYNRLDLSAYTLPSHLLRDTGAGLSREALRAEFARLSRLRERIRKFDAYFGSLDQGIEGRPGSEMIVSAGSTAGFSPYVYVEWDERHHHPVSIGFDERALDDPVRGLNSYHRANYGDKDDPSREGFFDRLFRPAERPRALWVQYPWVYSFQKYLGTDGAFRREVYETMRLEAVTRLKDGDAVADLGTGTGLSLWAAWLAAKESGRDLQYFASDLNPLAVANARLNFRLNGIPVETVVADVMLARDGRTAFPVPIQFLLCNAPSYSGHTKGPDTKMTDPDRNVTTFTHYDGGEMARGFWDRLYEQVADPDLMDVKRGTAVLWNQSNSHPLIERFRSLRAVSLAELIPADGSRNESLGYATYLVRFGPRLGRLGERLERTRADLNAAYGIMLRAVQNHPERERRLYLRLAFQFYMTLPTIGIAKFLPMAVLAASGNWWTTLAVYYSAPIVRFALMIYYWARHRLPMGRALSFSFLPHAGTFLALPAQVLDRSALGRARTVGSVASSLRKAVARSAAPSRVRRTALVFSLALADAVTEWMEANGGARNWVILGPGTSRQQIDRAVGRGHKVIFVGYRNGALIHELANWRWSNRTYGSLLEKNIHELDLGRAASALVSTAAPEPGDWIKPVWDGIDGARMALSGRPGKLVKRVAPLRDGVEVSVFEVEGLPVAVSLGVPSEDLAVTVTPLLKAEIVAAYLERGGMPKIQAADAVSGTRTKLWIEALNRIRTEAGQLSAKNSTDGEELFLESGVLGASIASGWMQFLRPVGADADAKSVYIVTPYGKLPSFEGAGGKWSHRGPAAPSAHKTKTDAGRSPIKSGARMASARSGGEAKNRSERALKELKRAREAVRVSERAIGRVSGAGEDLIAAIGGAKKFDELRRIRDKYAFDGDRSASLALSRRAAAVIERIEPQSAVTAEGPLSGEAFQELVARSAERAAQERMTEDPEGRMRAALGRKHAERLMRLLGLHQDGDRLIAWDEAGEEVKEYRSKDENAAARRVVTRHAARIQLLGGAEREVVYYLKRWEALGPEFWMLRRMAVTSFKRQEEMARTIHKAGLGPDAAFIGEGLAMLEDDGRPLSDVVADQETSMADRVRVITSVGEALGRLHGQKRLDRRGRVRYLTHGDLVAVDDSPDPADVLNDHIRIEPQGLRATFIDPGLASFEDDAGRLNEKNRLQQTLSRWTSDSPGSMVLYDAFESAYREAFDPDPPVKSGGPGWKNFSSLIKRWIGYIGWGGMAAFTVAALTRFETELYWSYIKTTAVHGWVLALTVMAVSLLKPGRTLLALSAAVIGTAMIYLRGEHLEPELAQVLATSMIGVMGAIYLSKFLYNDASADTAFRTEGEKRERLRRAALAAVWWSAAATPLARLYIGLFWNPFIQGSGIRGAWDKTIFDLGFASIFVHVPLSLLINLVYGELRSVGSDLFGGGWKNLLSSGPVRSLNKFYPVNSVFWMAALPLIYSWSGDDQARLLIASSVATAVFVFLVEKPLREWYVDTPKPDTLKSGARMAGREEVLERDRKIGADLDLAVERIMSLDVLRSGRRSEDWPARRRVAEALESSGLDLGNGYRYLDHGQRYVVFQNDAYPGLVFKKLKRGTIKRIYYEAWFNWLLMIKANPTLFAPSPSASQDMQERSMLRLPSVAGYAFSGGPGLEFVVQEHISGREMMAGEVQAAVDDAAKELEELGIAWRDSVTGNFKVLDDGSIVIVDTGDQSFRLQETTRDRLVEETPLPGDYQPPADEVIDAALRAVMGAGEYQMLFGARDRSASEAVSEDRRQILNGLRVTAVFYHAITSGLSAEAAAEESLRYMKWLKKPAAPVVRPPSVRAVVVHPGSITIRRQTSLWNGFDGQVEVMHLDPGTVREARAAAAELPAGFVVLHLRSDQLDAIGEISATIPAHVREFVTGPDARKGPAVPVIINIPHRATDEVLEELEDWKARGLIKGHVMLGAGLNIADHLDLAWLAAAYPDRTWTRFVRPIPGGWELRSRSAGAELKAVYGRADTGWMSWSRSSYSLTIEHTPRLDQTAGQPAVPDPAGTKIIFKTSREEDIELVPSEDGGHKLIIHRLAEYVPLAPAAELLANFGISVERAAGSRMAETAGSRMSRWFSIDRLRWVGPVSLPLGLGYRMTLRDEVDEWGPFVSVEVRGLIGRAHISRRRLDRSKPGKSAKRSGFTLNRPKHSGDRGEPVWVDIRFLGHVRLSFEVQITRFEVAVHRIRPPQESGARMAGVDVFGSDIQHWRLDLAGVANGPDLSRRYAKHVIRLASELGLESADALSQAGAEAQDALLSRAVGPMTFLRGLQWFGPIASYLPRFEVSFGELIKIFDGERTRITVPPHQWVFDSVASELSDLKKAERGRPYVLVIGGRSGSGKSTLAHDIKKTAAHSGIAAVTVSMDDFLLDRKTRIQGGLRGQDSFDHDAVVRVFDRIASGETARLPRTNAVDRNVLGEETIDFGSIDLVVVEGSTPLEFGSVSGIADRRIFLYESGETQYLSRHWRDQEERGFDKFDVAYSWITRGLREQASVVGSGMERYDQLIYKPRQPFAAGVFGRSWRLLQKKSLSSFPSSEFAGARMAVRPIDELTWEDGEEVAAHFKALLALFDIGTPRRVIRDSEALTRYSEPQPITAESLRELSAYGSTPARLYSTLRHDLIFAAELPEASESADWFHGHFGTNRSGAVWFEYHDGVRERIYRYIEQEAAAGRTEFKVLVHGTANGEDAAAMAILLDHRFPDLKFTVIGKDILRLEPDDLNWFAESRVPEELKSAVDKYFDVKGEVQDENKKPVRILGLKRSWLDRIILEQGDITRADAVVPDSDIVISTRLLFHAVTRKEDVRAAVGNVQASLKDGGLFVLQTAGRRRGEQEGFMKRYFSGSFTAEGEGVYVARITGSRMSGRPVAMLDRFQRAQIEAQDRKEEKSAPAVLKILPEIVLGALFGTLFLDWDLSSFFIALGLLVGSLGWHEVGHRIALNLLEWRADRAGYGPFAAIGIDWAGLAVRIKQAHEFSLDLPSLRKVSLAGPLATWALAAGFVVLEYVRLGNGPELLPRYMGLWAGLMNVFFWFEHMSPRAGAGGDHALASWTDGMTRLIGDARLRYGIDLLPVASNGFVLSSDLKQVYYFRQLRAGPTRVPGVLPLRFTVEGYPAPGNYFKLPVRGSIVRTLQGKVVVRTELARYALYKVQGIPPSVLRRYRANRSYSAARMAEQENLFPQPVAGTSSTNYNKSHLNRDIKEWETLRELIAPVIVRKVERAVSGEEERSFTAYVMGSSTGEEAARAYYEIDRALRSHHEDPADWSLRIIGIEKDPAVHRTALRRLAGEEPFVWSSSETPGSETYAYQAVAALNRDTLKARASIWLARADITDPHELWEALAAAPRPDLITVNRVLYQATAQKRSDFIEKVDRDHPSAILMISHARASEALRSHTLWNDGNFLFYLPHEHPQASRPGMSGARMTQKAERAKWTSLEDKIAEIGRDWNRDALQKIDGTERALSDLLRQELMSSRMRRLEAGEAAARALIEAARQVLREADGWKALSRDELAALTAARVPGFDRKRLDRLVHQMKAAGFPEFSRMVDEVTRYSPRTVVIPQRLLEYRRNRKGSRPDLGDLDQFIRAAEVSDKKAAVRYQVAHDPYLNRAWKLTAAAMLGDAARHRKEEAKLKEGARLAVLLPRAAGADELTAAAPETGNEAFFADPMNLRRLPRQFAMTVRVPASVPGSFEPVAVIAMPAVGRMDASGVRQQLEFFADRAMPLPSAHLKLRELSFETRSASTGPQPIPDAVVAAHLDHVQIFSNIDRALKSGGTRYAVHDVARYWDPEVLGSSVRADEHYKLLLNDLMTAVLGRKNWRVSFTYQGLPLDEPAPDYLNRRDRRLFYLARRALVKTGAHTSGAFPQDAYVIGDVDVATADAAADDPEILTMNGWSGAVISRSSGLRPSVPTLLLQLSLSSNAPVKAGDPVLDLLRMLTGKAFTVEEAEALRKGDFARIRSVGSLALFAIRNMGARLAERMEQAARTALAAGSSA